MHAEDMPMTVGPAAKHDAPACSVNGRRFNRVIIQAPHNIAYGSLFARRQRKMDVGGRAKILLLKMIRGLVSPTQFATRGTQYEVRIETGAQFVDVLVIKSLRAGMYCFIHVR